MKRIVPLMMALVTSLASAAYHRDTPINSATELRDWCKEESEAVIVGKGLTPYNWTASYWDQGNVLFVKGKWRVNGADTVVECSIARGSESRFGSMTLQDAS